jgi:hypothetical protein
MTAGRRSHEIERVHEREQRKYVALEKEYWPCVSAPSRVVTMALLS